MLLIESRIKLQEFDLAAEDLKKLEGTFGEQFQLKFLSALLLKAQGNTTEARQLLEKLMQVLNLSLGTNA